MMMKLAIKSTHFGIISIVIIAAEIFQVLKFNNNNNNQLKNINENLFLLDIDYK